MVPDLTLEAARQMAPLHVNSDDTEEVAAPARLRRIEVITRRPPVRSRQKATRHGDRPLSLRRHTPAHLPQPKLDGIPPGRAGSRARRLPQIADHIRQFWDPLMWRETAAYLAAGYAGLDPLAKAARAGIEAGG
jgi:NADH-dependant formate dehydrogenase delta subunit FdsD